MSMMKTSLTIFPCVLESALLYIRVCIGLSFATKSIGPPCFTLITFVTCYPLQIALSQNYMLPLISVLAENTLLKSAYHFLPLLVGFNTLTYRKDYDRSPTLVGHQLPTCPLALLVTATKAIPSIVAPPCFDTRLGWRGMQRHAGWLVVALVLWQGLRKGLHATTQVLDYFA